MALIKCPECGSKISDKSIECIKCGYPLDSERAYPLSEKTIETKSKKDVFYRHSI